MAHQEFQQTLSFHRPWSVDYQLAAATSGTVELKAVRSANHRLYIRHIIISPTTYAAQTLTFQDDAGTPVPIALASVPAAAPATMGNQGWRLDFHDGGTPLTTGTNLDMVISAAGIAGRIHIEGYEVLESPMAAGSNN